MSKKALCIYAEDVLDRINSFRVCKEVSKNFINGLTTKLVDRSICETDSSTLQLIPYVVLLTENRKVFCYSRGKGGAEERLHSKLSIGLGGHVDGTPPVGVTLWEHLQREAARELKEEAGITVAPSQLVFRQTIYDDSDEVGKVHIGLLVTYVMNDGLELTLEKDIVENGAFYSSEDLERPEIYNRLENWSQIACMFT